MGTEAVVLGHPAPMHIDAHRPLGARADAVAPVIQITETSARPADHRYMNLAQRLHHILAITTDIGDLAVWPDPDAFIDAPAQMLGELAIDMPVDHRTRLGQIDGQR